MEKNKTINLAKKLISIPSYVGQDCNEQKLGQFLYDYLARTFPWLQVSKQFIDQDRFNLIFKDSYPTQVLICGHIDTVEPRSGWSRNSFQPWVKGNKLYGLGSSDMKANIASLLTTLEDFKTTRGLMGLLYIDEEYDFVGIKKFISEYQSKIKPEVIISLDGADLKIGNGCRGLIEIKCLVKGETGHAARPLNGKNAILGSSQALLDLIDNLNNNFKSSQLGNSTANLAYIRGGLDQGYDKNGQLVLGQQGNNIANICEFVLEIRTASLNLDAKRLISLLQKSLINQGLKLINFNIRHDLKPWLTNQSQIKRLWRGRPNLLNLEFSDLSTSGYIDVQMLWQAFNQVPTFMLGAGKLEVAHKPNEYIEVNKLNKLNTLLSEILNLLLKGGDKDD